MFFTLFSCKVERIKVESNPAPLSVNSFHKSLYRMSEPSAFFNGFLSFPRTLALTIYGNLDLSIIDTMPPGRKPVETTLLVGPDRKAVYKRSNPRFSTQGAVSGGSRINRLKYQTKIKAQSTRYQVNGNDGTNKTSAVNTNLGPQSFDDHINSVNGFGGASNGTYPVSFGTVPTVLFASR